MMDDAISQELAEKFDNRKLVTFHRLRAKLSGFSLFNVRVSCFPPVFMIEIYTYVLV